MEVPSISTKRRDATGPRPSPVKLRRRGGEGGHKLKLSIGKMQRYIAYYSLAFGLVFFALANVVYVLDIDLGSNAWGVGKALERPPVVSEKERPLRDACELDAEVLDFLRGRGRLRPNYEEALREISIQKRYSEWWDAEDTCWLANQLLVTEAIGGFHPHCDRHSQNRNFLYALSTLPGSMRPATEAVKLMGAALPKFDVGGDPTILSRSYQLEGRVDAAGSEKGRMLEELEGPGLSVLPRAMDQDWLDRLTKKLTNSDFKQVSEGWTVKGLDPSAAKEKGWYGSFSLYDLNEAMAIEEVQQVAYDPFILDTLQDLMGAPPVIRAADIFMNIPKEDGSATKFSFDTWHKV